MENTVRLSDEELIDIASKAVREFFPAHVIETSTIEVHHSVMAPADVVDPDYDTKASVWFVHESDQDEFDPFDIARANKRVWIMLRERGDTRFLTLSHGYRSDPSAVRKAA
jgi:hypothetical protein